MITFGIKLGSTTLSGLTFSVETSRVDEVYVYISNLNSVQSQRVHMFMENATEQNVITGTMAEDFNTDLTLSVLLQASLATDVSPDLSKFLGIKSVEVELIP
jgi:hypothetical protein